MMATLPLQAFNGDEFDYEFVSVPWESLALENLTKQRTPKKRAGRVFAATTARRDSAEPAGT